MSHSQNKPENRDWCGTGSSGQWADERGWVDLRTDVLSRTVVQVLSLVPVQGDGTEFLPFILAIILKWVFEVVPGQWISLAL